MTEVFPYVFRRPAILHCNSSKLNTKELIHIYSDCHTKLVEILAWVSVDMQGVYLFNKAAVWLVSMPYY
jgi:hypothetical protein